MSTGWRFLAFVALCVLTTHTTADEQTIPAGRFGNVTVYRAAPEPSSVVLFISGDGGWNLGVIDMARALSRMDALVVGVDITRYLKAAANTDGSCLYAAADFELLSQFVQKHLALKRYHAPVLVGYSSGATLAYAVLVQAPPGSFAGAISMGFCPDLPLAKPLCTGNGLHSLPQAHGKGYAFLPAPELRTPWVAFQGTIDQVCDANRVSAFVRQTGSAEIVLLPDVGHGFSVQRHWIGQFRETFGRLVASPIAVAAPTAADVLDLPLVELPAQDNAGPNADRLAVIVSGDGGWASIDREVGAALARRGVSVVGLDSLRYFWTARTPEGAARDLARVLEHYLAAWRRQRVLLVGYSTGADVLPSLARRLPPELLRRVDLVALLGPGKRAGFEFHVGDWLGRRPDADALPVAPELARLRGPKVLCIAGEADRDSLCHEPDIAAGNVTVIRLEGGHHFGGNYQALAELLLEHL